MGGAMTFTTVIIIVFAILQIILFFKIWDMTNNVKRIRKKIDNKDFLSDACIAYVKGDIEITEKLANEAFLQEAALLFKSSEFYEDWLLDFRKLELKYTRVFQKIERPAPDFKKYRDAKIYLYNTKINSVAR